MHFKGRGWDGRLYQYFWGHQTHTPDLPFSLMLASWSKWDTDMMSSREVLHEYVGESEQKCQSCFFTSQDAVRSLADPCSAALPLNGRCAAGKWCYPPQTYAQISTDTVFYLVDATCFMVLLSIELLFPLWLKSSPCFKNCGWECYTAFDSLFCGAFLVSL